MATTMLKLPTLPSRDKASVPRSQIERLWMIGGGLVALVITLIGWFFFISPQRSNTADVKGQVSTAAQERDQLRGKLDALRAQNRNLPKYRAELAQARLALPSTSGVPDFLRTLQALGTSTHVDVTAVTVGQPTQVTAPVAAGASASPGAAASPSSTAPSDGTTTATSAGAPAAPAGAQLFSLAITASVTGAPGALDEFLNQLQTVQPRAVLLTSATESSGSTGNGGAAAAAGNTSLQLSMQAFVAPNLSVPSAAPSASGSS
jgi:hypothetical protein